MKSLSIVIPVYNGEKFIENCIESISKQIVNNVEVIVINDGSTDSTDALLMALKEKYPFVKYFKKENGGVSSARNFALDKVSNEYLWFVDADDSISDGSIKEVFNTEADLGVFNFTSINGETKRDINLASKDYTYNLTSLDNFFNEYVFKYKLNNALWNKVFKTSIIKENNIIFNEDIKIGEDFLFSLSYYRFVKSIYFSTISIYNYFINESGAMKSKNNKVFDYQKTIAKTIKLEYDGLIFESTLEQFLLLQLVCGINQAKERGVDKNVLNKSTKNYMQEIMNGKRFTKAVVKEFLQSEGTGILSKIKFRIKYKRYIAKRELKRER